ncbi:MAG: globin domain-containing protein [Pseudomonadota bacterium]
MPNFDEAFSGSMARVLGNGAYNPAFIRSFYDIFLETSPAVARKFENTDMSAQRTMLHDSLLMMVEFNKTRNPSPALQQLANSHSRRVHDVTPEFYDLWLDSLIAAVSRHDPEFNDTADLAWRIALAPGITYMRFDYWSNQAIRGSMPASGMPRRG